MPRQSPRYPPGPTTPRLHQLWRLNSDFLGFMESCAERYGDVFTISAPPYDAFVVATAPQDIQAILCDRDRFAGGEAADFIAPLVGERSVIVASGGDHMRQRKLLLPPFHGERVRGWGERIEAIAAAELDRLPIGETIALRPAMQRITFDVICRLVFGMEDASKIAEFNAAMKRLTDPRLAPMLFFPFMFRRGGRFSPSRLYFSRRDPVDRLIFAEISRHREDPGAGDRDDVLSMLIAARDDRDRPLSDEELRDELLGLLVAGHETTATALAWASERLSRHPAVQRRLAAELDEGGDAYLDAVIQETTRNRPPLTDGVRIAIEDTELGGHPIPAGTRVAARFCVTHRRADIWGDSLVFRPERFLEGKPEPYSFTPFGGGIRRCVGAPLANSEIRIVLRAMLKRFSLEPDEAPEEKMKLVGATLAPSKGGRVVLRRRPASPSEGLHPELWSGLAFSR